MNPTVNTPSLPLAGTASWLFAPIRPVLKRLRLRGKMMVRAVVLLPLIALLSKLVSRASNDLRATKAELQGATILRPLAQAMSALQVHRAFHSRALSGDASAKATLDSARAAVTKSLETVDVLVSARQALQRAFGGARVAAVRPRTAASHGIDEESFSRF